LAKSLLRVFVGGPGVACTSPLSACPLRSVTCAQPSALFVAARPRHRAIEVSSNDPRRRSAVLSAHVGIRSYALFFLTFARRRQGRSHNNHRVEPAPAFDSSWTTRPGPLNLAPSKANMRLCPVLIFCDQRFDHTPAPDRPPAACERPASMVPTSRRALPRRLRINTSRTRALLIRTTRPMREVAASRPLLRRSDTLDIQLRVVERHGRGRAELRSKSRNTSTAPRKDEGRYYGMPRD